MNELLFFPTLELLIRIVYNKIDNSIKYSSHKAITFDEREIIESYILKKIAPNTDYYKRTPAILLYEGIDAALENNLSAIHFKTIIKDVLHNKLVIDNKVKNLICHSLSNYYFERIGDELLGIRKLLKSDFLISDLNKLLSRIEVLLQAYNENSGSNILPEQILPKEVLEYYFLLYKQTEFSIK